MLFVSNRGSNIFFSMASFTWDGTSFAIKSSSPMSLMFYKEFVGLSLNFLLLDGFVVSGAVVVVVSMALGSLTVTISSSCSGADVV